MGDLAIALHLAEPESAVARSALHGLPVEDLDGAASPTVNFVVHHVLQALVVGWPQENLRIDFPACRVSRRERCQSELLSLFDASLINRAELKS